jgi:GT2 family glycosyltransferase
MYDIIIPHYGRGRPTELCIRCLETIRQYSTGYRIIFVDNGSPEFDRVAPELSLHPHILIRMTENVGFVKATNAGLYLSDAPYVVLMNNDTEAAEGWLEKLREPFSDPRVGLCGPVTTTPLSWQGRRRPQSGWELLPGGTLQARTAMLAFFCVMIRREVIAEIGVLDEDFGVGFGDDDWYCHQAHKAGWRLALARNLIIPHHHRTTFTELYGREESLAMQWDALAMFYEKKLPDMSDEEIQQVLDNPTIGRRVADVLKGALAAR